MNYKEKKMKSKKPKALILEVNWHQNRFDTNDNEIPDSHLQYFVCEPVWIEDDNPIQLENGAIISETGWHPDGDKIVGEYDTEGEALAFISALEKDGYGLRGDQ